MIRLPLPALMLAATLASSMAHAQAPAGFEEALGQGKLAEAERLMDEAIKAKPGDDNARFALGVARFLRAVESRMQAFHRHGFRPDLGGLAPMTNLPIPVNPKPEPIDAAKARDLLRGWVDDLARVEATLAPIKSPDVKLPIHFGLVRLDFDGDGKAGEEETLWKVYAKFNRGAANVSADAAKGFVIAFDRGDVDWLRGYCHLLSALAEVMLAHDFADLFDSSAHLIFAGAKAPDPALAGPKDKDGAMVGQALDFIAMIHRLRLPVAEPNRLKSALAHMETTVALSRSSWKAILAETDDDREWIPNPKQGTVVPGGKVTDEMVAGWMRFLDEFEAILGGKTLVPFWRGTDPGRGINIRRVFTDPRPFDLVFWAQGTAALPYLEQGDISSVQTWERIVRVFRGEFIGFAFWFN